MLQLMSIEEALVSAFIVPARRSRYIGLLESKRGREKFRRELAHFHHFDRRFIRTIPDRQQTPKDIESILRNLGAPNECVAFSEADQFDGKKLELGSALKTVVGQRYGTVLSCVPGSLAFYESEEPSERFILQRTQPSSAA